MELSKLKRHMRSHTGERPYKVGSYDFHRMIKSVIMHINIVFYFTGKLSTVNLNNPTFDKPTFR